MPHRTTLGVRFYELDPYNHVNHSAYIQYFEVARVELLDEIGMSMGELAERGIRIVVWGCRCASTPPPARATSSPWRPRCSRCGGR